MMANAANAAMPLRFSGSHVLIDGVYLNGKGPFRFLIDTGGQTSMLSPEVAVAVGFVPRYRVEMVSATGSTFAPAGSLDTVSLDGVSVWQMEVAVSDLAGLKRVDPTAVGVLGQSFLSRFRHRIDHRLGVIVFEEDPATISGTRLPVAEVAGRPAVSLSLGWFVLDSGAGSVTLFRGKPRGSRSRMTLSTLGGQSREVESTILPELDAGSVRLRKVAAVYCPDPRSEIDGLLPTRLFDSIYFDPAGGYVVLNPTVVSLLNTTVARRVDAFSNGGESRAIGLDVRE